MKDTYIRLNNRSIIAIKILMGIGVVLAFLGLAALLYYLFTGVFMLYVKSMWQIFFIITQGVIAIYIASIALKEKRYFISWNGEVIHYRLPKSQQAEVVLQEQIANVEIGSREVVISLKSGEEKRINLMVFLKPTRDQVVVLFEKLKQSACRGVS